MTLKKLKKLKGKKISCKLLHHDIPEGEITIENGNVFLCQNVRDGFDCNNKRGYKYSWFLSENTAPVVENVRVLEKKKPVYIYRGEKVKFPHWWDGRDIRGYFGNSSAELKAAKRNNMSGWCANVSYFADKDAFVFYDRYGKKWTRFEPKVKKDERETITLVDVARWQNDARKAAELSARPPVGYDSDPAPSDVAVSIELLNKAINALRDVKRHLT